MYRSSVGATPTPTNETLFKQLILKSPELLWVGYQIPNWRSSVQVPLSAQAGVAQLDRAPVTVYPIWIPSVQVTLEYGLSSLLVGYQLLIERSRFDSGSA